MHLKFKGEGRGGRERGSLKKQIDFTLITWFHYKCTSNCSGGYGGEVIPEGSIGAQEVVLHLTRRVYVYGHVIPLCCYFSESKSIYNILIKIKNKINNKIKN